MPAIYQKKSFFHNVSWIIEDVQMTQQQEEAYPKYLSECGNLGMLLDWATWYNAWCFERSLINDFRFRA